MEILLASVRICQSTVRYRSWLRVCVPQISISAQQAPREPTPPLASLLEGFQPSTLAWQMISLQIEQGLLIVYLQHR